MGLLNFLNKRKLWKTTLQGEAVCSKLRERKPKPWKWKECYENLSNLWKICSLWGTTAKLMFSRLKFRKRICDHGLSIYKISSTFLFHQHHIISVACVGFSFFRRRVPTICPRCYITRWNAKWSTEESFVLCRCAKGEFHISISQQHRSNTVHHWSIFINIKPIWAEKLQCLNDVYTSALMSLLSDIATLPTIFPPASLHRED